MNEDKKECADPTQSLTVQLPCQMVERMERYADDNSTDIGGVLIVSFRQASVNKKN